MREPEERGIKACRTCRDFGHVYRGAVTVPCPECSVWPQGKRADLLKLATKELAEKPSITESDLSDEEIALLAEWTTLYPNTHKLTFLTWIEGRRYDPEKDPVFLAEARKRFKKWQFLRNSNEGPVPAWAEHALRTGDYEGLSNIETEYVNSLKETP